MPRDASRRALLAGLAGALAGCAGTRSGATPTPTRSEPASSTSPPTRTTTPAPAPLAPGESVDAGGRTVTVRNTAVRVSIVTLDHGSSVHPDVHAVERAQFVTAEIVADGGAPPEPADLDVALDGERLGSQTFRYGTDRPSERLRRLAFLVPVTDVETAAVVWRRGSERVTWRLPERQRTAIGKRPAFEVREFSTPDSVRAGEAIDATLTVANVGDRNGRFLAELGAVVMSDVGEVSFPVAVGDEVTESFSLTPPSYTPMYGSANDPLRVVLDWGTGKAEREVDVVSETTADD